MGQIASKYVLGQYLPNQTVLHRLDPRIKLVASILLTGSVFAIQSWAGYVILILTMLCLIWLSKIGFRQLQTGLRLPLWFVLAAFVLHSVSTNGQVVWQAQGLTVTYQGIVEGVRIGLRLLLLATAGIILTATTSSVALTTALEVMLQPLYRFRVPVRAVALMMGMTLRFIPILLEEAEKLKKAQLSRGGFLEDGPIWQRLKTLYAMVIPLVVLTVKRADHLAQAMEARGFSVHGYIRVQPKPLQSRDYLSLIICMVIVSLSYLSK